MGKATLQGGLRFCAALLLCLTTSACFFAPGTFVSALDVHKDRTFSFRYAGEIYMIPMMEASKKAEFTPSPCNDQDTGEERACTPAELADQKQVWSIGQEEKRKSDAQAAQYLFGGIDPGDPAAAKEMAARLSRQAGWKHVTYMGKGKFDVEFAIAGTLDRDFAFPTIERFPMANAFVQLSLRNDGTVRVDAPGFGPAGGGGAAAMMGGLGGMTGLGGKDSGGDAPAPADGTFTVTTDAPVLANNTDDGPNKAADGRSTLGWQVNARTPAAPTALLKLGGQ